LWQDCNPPANFRNWAWNAAKNPLSRPLIAQNGCLKFNRSFEKRGKAMWKKEQRQASPEHSVARSPGREVPFVSRFFRKFALEVLPAVLASLLGGFLFAQFHAGSSPASAPPAEQVTPASPEVMALVRDEHAAVVGYLKSQMAEEKKRLAAEDAETAQAVEVAKAEEKAAEEKAVQAAQEQADQSAQDNNSAPDKVASGSQAPARRVASSVASKPVLPRAKPAVVVAASAPAVPAGGAPLVIAQADQTAQPDDNSNGRLAHDPDSLLAKTLDLKDQVVAATRHAVSAIGDVFTSVGEHITGAAPTTHQFSSDS
jgi:flagellar biosynthesis GTPase FlhF